MGFYWPWLLLLLLLVPLLVAVYIWVLRRKRKAAVRYSSLSLIREALPKHAWWRQHLPFILFLLGLACLAVAVARPVAEVVVPLNRTTIILALDVSRSMCSTDVSPNRLTIAQDAALAFVEDQADDTRIGIVAFARFAEIIVPPTNNKEVLKRAIRNITTSIGTAIGSATLKSIDAIAEVNAAVALSGLNLEIEADELPLEGTGYQPDIIVLLTDGANTHGPLPLDTAEQAAARKVRVYTIGFGTTNPGRMVCAPEQLGGGTFGGGFGDPGGGFGGGGFGGGGGGSARFLMLDEPTLQGVADITGGAYYRAEDAQQLYDIFTDLPREIAVQKERLEMSVVLSLLGAVFAVSALALALLWRRFP